MPGSPFHVVSRPGCSLPGCRACVLRKKARQVVVGSGPLDAEVLLVGEGPGELEDKQGEPFVGKTGWELDALLRLAGLWREDVRLSNLVRCRPPDNRDPKPEEVEQCERWLRLELEELAGAGNLKLVVPVGRAATRWFLGDTDMEKSHGLVYLAPPGRVPELAGAEGCHVLPVYHPAAGLHNQEMMAQVRSDFLAVKRWLGGEWKGVVRDMDDPDGADQYPLPKYKRLTTPSEVRAALGDSPLVSVDTESEKSDEAEEEGGGGGAGRFGDAWCLTFSIRPGEGYMVRATETEALKALQERLANPDILTILHNSLYDLSVLREMDVEPVFITDTMIMAYLLQDEPQGLKPLAYRHAGMRMRSYLDVVGPKDRELTLAYLEEAVVVSGGVPDPEPQVVWEKGEPRIKQPQGLQRKIKRVLTDYRAGRLESGTDLRRRWLAFGPEEGRSEVEEVLGPMPRASLSDVPDEESLWYACRDADATMRVYSVLWGRIKEEGLQWVLERDVGMAPLVDEMMENGFRINRDKFRELAEMLTARMDELATRISEAAGKEINPGSSPQVGWLLFKKLGLKVIRRTATGPSTDTKALSRLRGQHPAVEWVQDWRAYQKLRDSFALVIPRLADPVTHRVHTTLRTTRVSTGRLASSSPNLMAQPVRTAEGRMIRDGFEAAPGYELVSGDYSQVEMRLTAHDSQDPTLIRIFREGLDIHSQTASRMFGIPVDQLDEMLHRYPAKRVGFGILNDISPEGLQREMVVGGARESDWSIKRCTELIEQWFEVYDGVKAYMERNRTYARRYMEVRDIWGRRRLVPGVKAANQRIREEAYRQAGNAPIQMGAQGIIKEAMRRLVPRVKEWNREYQDGKDKAVKALIQIHDDLVWELRKDVRGLILPEIKRIMEGATEGAVGAGGKTVEFSVPLLVDFKVGERWGSMEKHKMAA